MIKVFDHSTPLPTYGDDEVLGACGAGYYAVIDGVQVIPCKLRASGKWWLIPNGVENDQCFAKIGPFDTPEQAVLQLKLLGS